MSNRLLCCTGSLDGGGSERQLLQLATHVNPYRFAPQIYLLHRRGPWLASVPKSIPVHAFDSTSCNTSYSNFLAGPTWLPGQVHRRQVADLRRVVQREGIDVIYDRTFHMTLVTGAVSRASRVGRVSVIVSPPSRDFGGSRERFKWLKFRKLRRAYSDPRTVTVAVSEAVADDAAAFYRIAREPIVVLPNPVDMAGVRSAAEQPISESSTTAFHGSPGLNIVVVGRLTAEKGQATAITALALAKGSAPELQMNIHLVGDGSQREELQQLARELGVAECVQFHGFQPNPYPWIRSADALCIPSRYEGLPNVALEAMALGTPVISTACSSSVQELLGDSRRGALVAVDDAQGLSEVFLAFRRQQHRWVERTRLAMAWVEEHHRLERWLTRTQSALKRAIALKREGRHA